MVTSYDYDCPLTEWGDPGEKFLECQRILKKYTDNPNIREVAKVRKIVPTNAKLTSIAPLRANLQSLSTSHVSSVTPPTMDELGETFGFVLYRTRLDAIDKETSLTLHGIGDYAQVWLEGVYMGHRYRSEGKKNPIQLPPTPNGALLEILVENTGRINYGPYLGLDPKGLTGPVCRGLQQQFHWEVDLLPLAIIPEMAFAPIDKTDEPARFYQGTFFVDEPGEAFLKHPGAKGCVWINGFNLGRYWEIGPTETLYVPSPILKPGENRILILEQERLDSTDLTFLPEHDLGELEIL